MATNGAGTQRNLGDIVLSRRLDFTLLKLSEHMRPSVLSDFFDGPGIKPGAFRSLVQHLTLIIEEPRRLPLNIKLLFNQVLNLINYILLRKNISLTGMYAIFF